MFIYCFKNPTLRVPKKIEIHKALNIHLYFYAQLRRSVFKMVGAAGFEPTTSSSQAKRSTKLSHAPKQIKYAQALSMK